jgi:hypothetical protein
MSASILERLLARCNRISGERVSGSLLALLVAGQNAALAIEPESLTGWYFIAGETLVDPPPGEPPTHAYITIEGQAAMDIYEALADSESADVCQPDRLMKVADGLYCSMASDRSEATCDLSLDLRRGALAGGRPC